MFDKDGYKFIVDKDLMSKAQPITVDLTYMGFQVHSSMELGGGGCGSSCSTGSCSSQ